MNLQKLFEMQAKLDADITAHHPVQEGENRLEKKVLALLVELGECANEWRGFKFWSNDQEPRNYCKKCAMTETQHECKNPLLEEYIDVFHFALSIGNDIGFELTENIAKSLHIIPYRYELSEEIFYYAFENAIAFKVDFTTIGYHQGRIRYAQMLRHILALAGSLGFTWEQVEQAYYDKNKVNFERQEQGY